MAGRSIDDGQRGQRFAPNDKMIKQEYSPYPFRKSDPFRKSSLRPGFQICF